MNQNDEKIVKTTITFRLSKSKAIALDAYCKQVNRCRANCVETIVSDFLDTV